jgi:hypothetical protein
MTDDELLTNITLPTDEQVERAAKIAAVSYGSPPEHWPVHAGISRLVLVIVNNQTKINLGV